MRHNDPQAKIGEEFGVSQSTISRAIAVITSLVAECTREFAPTADDLEPEAQYIIDGTLLPCWSWKDRPELYSGKHKTTGLTSRLPAPFTVAFPGSRTQLPATIMTATA